MEIPEQPDLPVHLLAACFNKTSATYKFYWFMAIINQVEMGKLAIAKRDLFAENDRARLVHGQLFPDLLW